MTATKSSSRPLPLGLHHDIPSLPFTRVPLDSTSTSGPPPPYPRQSLKRRRSSYPPTQVPSHTESFPFNFEADTTKVGGKEMTWPAEPSWESLLNFTPGSPRDDPFENKNIFKMNSDAGPSTRALSGNKIAQMGEEMAWKTILGTVVDVEAVGGVPVAKLLQEIWKRGGGDAVTNQCLWPSIIISLSTGNSPQERISNPTAHSALALQQLYNLSLRNWEPSIFAGLLQQWTSSHQSHSPFLPEIDNVPVYGAATPTKHFESGQWTTLTPGFDWSNILNGVGNAVVDPREDTVGGRRRSSYGNDESRGIDELLAEMEEGREASERKASIAREKEVKIVTPGQTTFTPGTTPPDDKAKLPAPTPKTHLPTPETDSSSFDSPVTQNSTRQNSYRSPKEEEPDQAKSPYVTGGSVGTSCSTVSRALSTGSRAPHPTSVIIPENSFVPPPPMCMFFNPSFKDITQGKIGAWKGDLDIKGSSGGRFSILVIAETGSEEIWQTQGWGDTISYPPTSLTDAPISSTSSMIPVAHLAREGYVPSAMAMVLCNDPDVQGFCAMVQGLHQEGVAFHLPNAKKLPLMFLPAKFDSTDNLQRLGLAFMSKSGNPAVPPLPAKNAKVNGEVKEEGKKRKRRQSAPAQAGFKGGASRASTESGGSGGRKKRISLGLPKVSEDGSEGKETED